MNIGTGLAGRMADRTEEPKGGGGGLRGGVHSLELASARRASSKWG